MNPMRLVFPRCAGIRPAIVAFCLSAFAAAAFAQENASGEQPRSQALGTDFLTEEGGTPAADLTLSRVAQRRADALAAFARGFIAESDADSEHALEHYRLVLQIDPSATIRTPDGDELLLSVKVAYELARRGDVPEGIGILKDSIKAVPNDPLPYLYLSTLYAKFLHKPDLALKYATKAVELDPEEIDAYSTIYEIHVAAEQPKRAEQILDRAAKVNTSDPHFWAKLGDLYLRLLAKEDGSTPPEARQKLDAIFSKAVTLAPADLEVLSKAGDYYVITNQVDKAASYYERVIATKPDSTDPDIIDVRDKLARTYLASGQREKAVAALQKIIKLSPLRHEAYEMLGDLYQQDKQPGKALAQYEQSILLAPNQPANYLRIAAMQQETGQLDKAVATVQEARKRFPDQPRITYTLALALSQAKRHQEAVAVFEEALYEAERLQDELINGDFYFYYGAAAEQAGLVDKATDLLRKSIEIDPANAGRAYNYIGYMWVDRGENLEEAGKLIRRALEYEPDNAAFIDSLGWYYFKTGQHEKALAELLRAAQAIEPEDAVVYDHLGDAYSKLNNIAQALVYWQKAAALDESNKQIAGKIEDAKAKLTALPGTPPEKE